MMPGIDGIETMQQLRIIDASLPVIMVTADHDVQRAVEVTKLGAYDYLTKPLDEDLLFEKLEQYL